jgi:uncharacterized protein (UPF0276 family)
MRTGVAFRPELAVWLASCPREVDCVELRVDRTAGGFPLWRPDLTESPRVVLNAPRLSLGTSEALAPADLCDALRAAYTVNAVWISAYLGSRRRPEPDLAYPDPLTPSRTMLGRVIGNCRQIVDACARPVLVENVVAFRRTEGSMSEAEFINRLCDETGSGVLLDVTALALDARHGFDARAWVWDVDPRHIVALRLGGWRERGGGRWAGRREGRVAVDAWDLAGELAAHRRIQAAILQSDGGFPGLSEIRTELCRVAALNGRSQPERLGLDRAHAGAEVRWRPEPARAPASRLPAETRLGSPS